jgi:SAM-dependent methyltransferase
VYEQSARVYDALFRRKDYAAASHVLCTIVDRFAADASSLLDVACGTGRHLEHLRRRFDVEGLDLSQDMLAVARDRCPGVRLHQASLLDFSLGRRFDVVTCLFGSIAYAPDAPSLQRAMRRLAAHVQPGGLLIVEPWITPERFVDGRLVFDSVDDPDLKVARMYVTRRKESVSVFESEYLVGTVDGVIRFSERQELGLFTDVEYRTALAAAGFEVVDASGDLFGYGLYVCRFADVPALGKG